MGTYGRIEDIPTDDIRFANRCKNGKCSSCGECCTDLLPLTKGELERIRQYARKHDLKEHRQAPFYDRNATDLTYPFRNQHTKKCEVYSVRPQICRSFICSKTLEDAKNDRDLITESRQIYSLRYEIFGNPESAALLIGACLEGAGLL